DMTIGVIVSESLGTPHLSARPRALASSGCRPSSRGLRALASEVGAVAGAEQVDEERGAAEGGDHADRELGRGDDAAGQRVGEQKKDAAADESGRHQQAI